MGTIRKSRNENNNDGDTVTSSAIDSANDKTTTTTTTDTISNIITTRIISSNLSHVIILISILLVQLQQQKGVMAFRVNISARHQHVFKAHLFREHGSIQLHGQISAGERAFLLQQAAAIGANRTKPSNTSVVTPGGMMNDNVHGGDDSAEGESMTLTQSYDDNGKVPKDSNVVDEIRTLLNLPNEMRVPAAVEAPSKEQEQYQMNRQESEMGAEGEDSDDNELEYEDYNYEENNNQIYIFDNNNNSNDSYYGYKIPRILFIFVISMNVTMTILYLGIFAMALFLSSEKRVQKIKSTDICTKI